MSNYSSVKQSKLTVCVNNTPYTLRQSFFSPSNLCVGPYTTRWCVFLSGSCCACSFCVSFCVFFFRRGCKSPGYSCGCTPAADLVISSWFRDTASWSPGLDLHFARVVVPNCAFILWFPLWTKFSCRPLSQVTTSCRKGFAFRLDNRSRRSSVSPDKSWVVFRSPCFYFCWRAIRCGFCICCLIL